MKARIQLWSDKIFKPINPIPSGMYHFQSPQDAPNPYRMHLRVEPDGQGLLVINASTILHLNQTAAEYAYYFIQRKEPSEVGRIMRSRYKIDASQAARDYENLSGQVNTLVTTTDLAPELFIDLERLDPYSAAVSAPYRLDCALTYKSLSDPSVEAKASGRVERELTTEEWQSIFEKAARVGIPHVILTGGEPTTRPDLVELITHTEKLELVCGLITDGSRLSDPAYLHSLLNAGLDHLMVLLEDQNTSTWEGLKDALAEDIYITVHLTLSKKNSKIIRTLIDKLSDISVPSISLSMDSKELSDHLQDCFTYAQQKGMKTVWDLPVPHSSLHPIAVELAGHNEYSSGAGKAWIYVQPDGDVYPDQGEKQKLGNLLTDEWESIWKNH